MNAYQVIVCDNLKRNNEDVGFVLVSLTHLVGWRKLVLFDTLIIAQNRQRLPGGYKKLLQVIFLVEHRLQIGGQRRFQFNAFSGERVSEAQLVGVQELAIEPRSFEDVARPIDGVPHHRVADGFQVQANLVGAASLQLQQKQRMTREPFKHLEVGARLPAANGSYRHLLAMAWISADGRVNTALVKRNVPFNQRQVQLGDGMVLHLFEQRGARARVLRHDYQAGGISIQAMDNAGSQHLFRLLQSWQVGQQRINQGIIMVSRGGMHNHPGWLIHYQQVLIFKNDV